MPTPTFTLIASSTVGAGGASNITFSSIPSTYTDLSIVLSGRGNSTGAGNTQNFFNIRPNGSTTNYTYKRLYNDGGTVASDSGSYSYLPSYLATASTYGSTSIYIPNYASTTTGKSISVDTLFETNGTSIIMGFQALLWNDTTAISSVALTNVINSSGSASGFEQYSTAYLYGIVKQ
jgi:hypothetical protein